MRPVFSYYGKLSIDDHAVAAIVRKVVLEGEISEIGHINVSHLYKGDEDLGLKVSCSVVLTYGNHIPTLITKTQRAVRQAVEYMTGMMVHEVDIVVKALYVQA